MTVWCAGLDETAEQWSGENGEFLIMPANSRWDLIRGLKD